MSFVNAATADDPHRVQVMAEISISKLSHNSRRIEAKKAPPLLSVLSLKAQALEYNLVSDLLCGNFIKCNSIYENSAFKQKKTRSN